MGERATNDALRREQQSTSEQHGADAFLKERNAVLKAKAGAFQESIYNLMGLMTTVEQEFMLKTGKLPKVTKAIDWRNEFDPKKYKQKSKQTATHSSNATFIETQLKSK